MKLSVKDRALLISHRLHRGLYARVAKRLRVDASFVNRVASGARKSDTIMRVGGVAPDSAGKRLKSAVNGADPKQGRGNQVPKFRPGCKARGGTNRILVFCPCPEICFLSFGRVMRRFTANTLMTNVTKSSLKCSTANKRVGRLII
jgi:hypothetical protein